MPFVDVYHAIAPIDLHHRRDQRDDVRADELHVGSVVDRQPVSEFHQRGGRAGFGRMDRAGDVVNRERLADQRLRFGVIQPQCSRIGKLCQACAVLLGLSEQSLIGDCDGDHLAPLLAMADREDLHPRTGRGEQSKVPIHVFRIGQNVRRAGHIAQNFRGSWHGIGRRKVIGKRRIQVRRGGVLSDELRVGFVNGLLGVALERFGREGLRSQGCRNHNQG